MCNWHVPAKENYVSLTTEYAHLLVPLIDPGIERTWTRIKLARKVPWRIISTCLVVSIYPFPHNSNIFGIKAFRRARKDAGKNICLKPIIFGLHLWVFVEGGSKLCVVWPFLGLYAIKQASLCRINWRGYYQATNNKWKQDASGSALHSARVATK